MSLDPDRIYHHILSAASEWTAADEDARRLKELQPIVLAELTNHMSGESMAERKALALADPQYKLHVTQMVAAKTKANAAKARYDAAKNLSELRRSQESTARAEMQLR